MSKMLFNPTNETLSHAFGGVTTFFAPGERKMIEDEARAKHLLHNLTARGLTILDYGCDEGARAQDGINRNLEFKKKQVVEFNQRNEQRKQTHFPYLAPTKEIKDYALELGIGLVEPYTLRDYEHAAYAKLRQENDSLRDRLAGMDKNMEDLKGMIAKLANPDDSPNRLMTPRDDTAKPARMKG